MVNMRKTLRSSFFYYFLDYSQIVKKTHALTLLSITNNRIKMKFVLYLFLWILSLTSFAQLREGFKPEEAKNLIALCNSYTFLDLYDSDTEILFLKG